MSVTQYTIPCRYNIPKLKDTVYFVSKSMAKIINIDNGTAFVTINNPSPYPMSPSKLQGFNIKLNETESLDERYKFTKQLTMSIHGHLTDSRFLMDDDYYIVVQTEDGTYYLVNVDFPSKMTYTYNLSEGQNQTDFTFTSNSNYPTLKLNWSPTTWNTCQTYQLHGIDSLKLLEKAYTSIDSNGVINLFDDHEFKDVDFLKNTAALQEAYDGEITTTTISFEIPFNNYKPSWQYNLLEFDKNLYTAHITPKNSESGIFAGYEHGLQPSYEINGSTSIGESTTIKITLVETSNWGLFEFDTWSYYRDSSKRWIGVDSEHICVAFGIGAYLLMQEVDGNGTPTGRYKCLEGYESEYTNYNIVGTYDEAPRFASSDCGRSMARGSRVVGYTCIDGDKYELRVNTISYDNNKTNVDEDEYYYIGSMVESASPWCYEEVQYKWELTTEWVCRPQFERWIPSGTTCIGIDKYQNNYKQVSDDKITWIDSDPLEWSASTVIEYNSEDCGYQPFGGKYALTLNDSRVISAECDSTSSIRRRDISAYTKSVVNAVIGNCITSIDSRAFIDCKSLSSVTIPNSVTNIDSLAFFGCSGLTSLELPSNVGAIWSQAFAYCESVTNLVIPNSLTVLDSRVFAACFNLENVTIGSGLTGIPSDTFQACFNLKSIGDVGSGASIEIPSNIKSIGDSAFISCYGLTSVTIPDCVEAIGEGAFQACTGLTSLTIGSGVTSIKNSAFLNCYNLRSITMLGETPPTLTDADRTFAATNNCPIYVPCASLAKYRTAPIWERYIDRIVPIEPCHPTGIKYTITLRDSSTVSAACYAATDIVRSEVQAYSGTARDIEIGECVKTIGWGTFQNFTALTSVSLPQYLTTINDYAFAYSTGLTTINIPNSVEYVGERAFDGCMNLPTYNGVRYADTCAVLAVNDQELYNLKNGIRFIGTEAFAWQSNLRSMVIPGTVARINSYAFRGCSSLTSVTIPNGISYIGEAAFYDCNTLDTANIPVGLKTIPTHCFHKCNLTSVTIPDSVEIIGDYAFNGNISLENVEIPSGVTYFGDDAFGSCINLRSITFHSITPPTNPGRPFNDCGRLSHIYVPAQSVDAYKATFSYYSSLIYPIPT